MTHREPWRVSTKNGLDSTYLRWGMCSLCTYLQGLWVFALYVDNSPESHKSVEISDLRLLTIQGCK